MEIKLTAQQKTTITEAATLARQRVSDFVRSAACDVARKLLEKKHS
ncbi:MAG: type II toxin -antitoxin system TacA 1-like antitoxin [Vulcanimicrobiaceae bacterium]